MQSLERKKSEKKLWIGHRSYMLLHLVGAGVSGFDIVIGVSYLGIWNLPTQTIPEIYHPPHCDIFYSPQTSRVEQSQTIGV